MDFNGRFIVYSWLDIKAEAVVLNTLSRNNGSDRTEEVYCILSAG